MEAFWLSPARWLAALGAVAASAPMDPIVVSMLWNTALPFLIAGVATLLARMNGAKPLFSALIGLGLGAGVLAAHVAVLGWAGCPPSSRSHWPALLALPLGCVLGAAHAGATAPLVIRWVLWLLVAALAAFGLWQVQYFGAALQWTSWRVAMEIGGWIVASVLIIAAWIGCAARAPAWLVLIAMGLIAAGAALFHERSGSMALFHDGLALGMAIAGVCAVLLWRPSTISTATAITVSAGTAIITLWLLTAAYRLNSSEPSWWGMALLAGSPVGLLAMHVPLWSRSRWLGPTIVLLVIAAMGAAAVLIAHQRACDLSSGY